jgi:chaperonin GroEL
VAYLRILQKIQDFKLEGDENLGAEIVKKVLRVPAQQIAENAGYEGSVIVEKILEDKNPNYGFNALKGEFEDLVKAGVIDPAKVTRIALENAASVAGLLLMTNALVAEIPEKEEKTPGTGMDMY